MNYFVVSQTNPHIVPILNLKRHIGKGLFDMIEGEFKHRFNMVRKLVPEQSAVGRICRLMTQQWEGDVTVSVPGFFYSLEKLITNPTPAQLMEAVHQGEQAMWEKLSAVDCNCAVEVELDRCLARLTQTARLLRKVAVKGLKGSPDAAAANKARIPRWVSWPLSLHKERCLAGATLFLLLSFPTPPAAGSICSCWALPLAPRGHRCRPSRQSPPSRSMLRRRRRRAGGQPPPHLPGRSG